MSAREAATAVAAKLSAAGHTAYFAGGCVRDSQFNLKHAEAIETADFDIATSASLETVRSLFSTSWMLGEAFGVVLVREGHHTVQVARFRKDGPYSDSRRPDSVDPSSEIEDAKRRDFTINGLFEDPATGEIIDHVEGMKDIASRTLRAVGDADARINEDRLRMLRAVRFVARFDLAIDPATRVAIERHAGELTGVSRERIGGELRRVMTHRSRCKAAELMEELGLDAASLTETHSSGTLSRLRALPELASFSCAIAAWWLDRAERESPARAFDDGWERALMLSKAESEAMAATVDLVRSLSDPAQPWGSRRLAARRRLAMHRQFGDAVSVLAAKSKTPAAEIAEDFERFVQLGLCPKPLINGNHLIALGCAPGPLFRSILDTVYDLQLEGELSNEAAAMVKARLLMSAPA